MNSNQLRIWIDINNSPHVPFFCPIIKKLQHLGHSVVVTARDYTQSIELLASIPKYISKERIWQTIKV